MSDSRYLAGSPQLIENLKKSPKLIQEEQFEDKERGIVRTVVKQKKHVEEHFDDCG